MRPTKLFSLGLAVLLSLAAAGSAMAANGEGYHRGPRSHRGSHGALVLPLPPLPRLLLPPLPHLSLPGIRIGGCYHQDGWQTHRRGWRDNDRSWGHRDGRQDRSHNRHQRQHRRY